jgi:hypothetical protein
MKKNKTILLQFIIPLFLLTSFLKETSKEKKEKYSPVSGTGDLAKYEVRFTFTGYTTLYVGPPDCPVRPNGKVVLAGILSGIENVNSDDDIFYTGNLQLDINMDICSVKRLPNGEDKFCVMTVTGFGPVKTELELYFNGPGQDSSRGGYIKINYDPKLGPFTRKVTGDCDTTQTKEELVMVPNETIASIFNGTELPMLKRRTLHQGSYVETGPSGKLEVEVLRVIKP